MSMHCGVVMNAAKTITDVLFTAVSAMTVAALAVTSACSTHRSAAEEVSKAITDWHRPSILLDQGESGELPAVPSAERSVGVGITEEEEGHGRRSASPSPLQSYVRQALERNPSVRAASADARAKLERIAQVTSLPDPVLRAIVRPEPIQTAAGDMYFTLGVGQTIPLPAKLEGAGRSAAAEVRMAIERLNAVRLGVIADVEQAYYRLYLTDRSIELTEAHRQLLEELEPVLASQYRAGGAEQQDLLRIQIEIAKLRDDENRLGRRRASAAAALNQLLDYPPDRELAGTLPISPRTFDADVEQLIALAAAHNPELATFTHRAQRDREEIALARLAHWPDATIGFEWTYTEPRDPFIPPINPQTGIRPPYNDRSDGGDDNWALTLQLNLPIWLGRIEAAKREARQRLHETQHEKQAVLNKIAFRVYDAWVRVQTQQETIRLLESTLIPQAKQTYEVSLTSYQAGKTDFLTVIDNWRRLLDFELMLHREVADLEIAFSELQRQVSVQLEEKRG
ncbi:MAG: TolC family protein [Phycisphaerales bacterium]|nr:MAG: TolC family protein [Phycisphaerales bacterium]